MILEKYAVESFSRIELESFTMKEITFDIRLTAKDLFLFSMRHTYTAVSGIFGVVISLGSWIILTVRFGAMDTSARLALFIIGCLFTVIQPLMLYSKSAAQARQNKDINASLHYSLNDEGITVTQGEQEVTVKWYEVRKCITSSRAVYLYMSPVRAFIFPADQCGEKFVQICRICVDKVKEFADYDQQEDAGEADGHKEDS